MGTDRSIYLALSELARRYAEGAPASHSASLAAAELRCFSQNGEDGVIAEILGRVGNGQRFFVEFGAESGDEGNCVFLADVQAWRGLFIEADPEDFQCLANKYAANSLVRVIQASVTPENIEGLLDQGAVPAEPDVLSIDIDGADYWVWEAITSRRPRLTVIEYNAALGVERRRVQPRDHSGGWNGTDNFGASLAALTELGVRKGYRLVHTELAACNAFFVRDDLIGDHFPGPSEIARWGRPNYFMQGMEHPHDPQTEAFVDPLAPGSAEVVPPTETSHGSVAPERSEEPPGHEPCDQALPASPADERFSPRERIMLTLRYHGAASVAYRLLSFPLRFTPLEARVRRGTFARRFGGRRVR
jgi:hypothetical protein